MSAREDSADTHLLSAGTKVDVRAGFDGEWTNGFAVAEQVDGGYRLRRRSDDTVLPTVFGPDQVRRERRNSMWWY